MSLVFFYIPWKHHKTSRPNPRRKEKINLNFYFALLCYAWKGFMKVFKAFIKPSEAPQRSVKIKIELNFLFWYKFLKCTGREGLNGDLEIANVFWSIIV